MGTKCLPNLENTKPSDLPYFEQYKGVLPSFCVALNLCNLRIELVC